MDKQYETIANAGNTEVPCFLAIKSLGYEFSRTNAGTANEFWIAEKDGKRFVASNQLELLGLIYMRLLRGNDWKAQDKEIADYLSSYYSE